MSIVAVVQNQLLQTLFKALDLASLENGQEVEARVVSTTSDGKATLDIGGKQITANFQNTAALSAALIPGSRVGLKVDFSHDEPRLILNQRNVSAEARSATANSGASGTIEAEPSLLLGAAVETPETRAKPPIEIFKFVEPEVAAKAEALLAAPNPRTVLLQSAINAVLKQNGAGALIADLEALLTPPSPQEQATAEAAGTVPLQARPLPAPLFNAALNVLRQQIDANEPIHPQDLRQALRQSGLFFEAQLAKGNAPSPAIDFKAALLSLKDIAQKLLVTLQPADEPEAAKPFQSAETLLRSSPAAPRRDAPPEPQRPPESPIGAQTEPREAVSIIASHAEQALERLKLLQFASLPPSPDNPVANQAQKTNAQVWAFEVPLRFAQETAVAGFKIEHDREARSGPAGSKLWRINFAIETSELGAVQGSIGLRGAQLAIALFAERRETAEMFRGAAPDLKDTLTASDFELTDLSILTGKPKHAAPRPGYFVNSAA